MKGKSTRIRAYKCYQRRKPFTVKIGTIFESSHIPLRFWLQAIDMMSSSKKGISANHIHRTFGITSIQLGSCAIVFVKPWHL